MTKQLTNQKLMAIKKLANEVDIDFNELKPYLTFVIGMWGSEAKAITIFNNLVLISDDFRKIDEDEFNEDFDY
jgi:hypothetical protein